MATPAEPESRKRRADAQLTKDDAEAAAAAGGAKEDDGGKSLGEPFPLASDEALGQRRIVKATRPGETKDGEAGSGTAENPFKKVALTLGNGGGKPSWGQAAPGKLTGLGQLKNPFAKALSASSTSGLASPSKGGANPFASTSAPKNPFMSFNPAKPNNFWGKDKAAAPASTLKVSWGSSNGGAAKPIEEAAPKAKAIFGAAAAAPAGDAGGADGGAEPKAAEEPAPVVSLAEVKTENGEEAEDVAHEVRAKLYRFAPAIVGDEDKESVKLVQSSAVAKASKTEAKEEEGKAEGESEAKDNGAAEAAKDGEAAKVAAMKWVEVGIGPLRLLARRADDEGGKRRARLVMRRESAPGGPGTKVILNVALNEQVAVVKQMETSMRLSCMDSVTSKPTTYLLRVKRSDQCDDLLEKVESFTKGEN